MLSSEGTATGGEQGGHTFSWCGLRAPVILTLLTVCTGAGLAVQIAACVSRLQYIFVDGLS